MGSQRLGLKLVAFRVFLFVVLEALRVLALGVWRVRVRMGSGGSCAKQAAPSIFQLDDLGIPSYQW